MAKFELSYSNVLVVALCHGRLDLRLRVHVHIFLLTKVSICDVYLAMTN
ncbi:hypothetical protein [Vibrio owensii]